MKSGKNYFVCNRSLFKNPLWYAEKFTKGQAWVDLFGKANHSPGYFEKNGQRINLERGQTGRSIETLADDWGWSRNKVKRFLKRLKDEQMIDHKPNHLTTIITICNYDKFQFDEKENEPSNEPSNELPDELPDEPQTNKKKERTNKELIISIVNYLNEKLGTNYKPGTGKTKSCINARINEGNQFEQFKIVIDKKYNQWFGTDDAKFLRPETLFGTKFDGYLNQLDSKKTPAIEKLSFDKFKEAIEYKKNNQKDGIPFRFKDESLNKLIKKYPLINEYPFDSIKFEIAYKEYKKL